MMAIVLFSIILMIIGFSLYLTPNHTMVGLMLFMFASFILFTQLFPVDETNYNTNQTNRINYII